MSTLGRGLFWPHGPHTYLASMSLLRCVPWQTSSGISIYPSEQAILLKSGSHTAKKCGRSLPPSNLRTSEVKNVPAPPIKNIPRVLKLKNENRTWVLMYYLIH